MNIAIYKQAAQVAKTDPSRAYDMLEKTAGSDKSFVEVFNDFANNIFENLIDSFKAKVTRSGLTSSSEMYCVLDLPDYALGITLELNSKVPKGVYLYCKLGTKIKGGGARLAVDGKWGLTEKPQVIANDFGDMIAGVMGYSSASALRKSVGS